MFKTELHCHSKDVSACARVDVDTIINKFTEAGYSSLFLTNHFNGYTYDHLRSESWDDFIDKFLHGYTKLKDAAEGKLNILFGLELRFDDDPNDYLVYGPDERFLRDHPFFYRDHVGSFHKICKEHGFLFIQAHPFRGGMRINQPWDLDGIEVFNGHMGHDSRNDIADMWADKFSLIKTSGTDFHYADVPANAGIFTEYEIKSVDQLIETLKSGSYTLNRIV